MRKWSLCDENLQNIDAQLDFFDMANLWSILKMDNVSCPAKEIKLFLYVLETEIETLFKRWNSQWLFSEMFSSERNASL